MDSDFWRYFYEIFDDLPRGGPGDEESTLRALRMIEFETDQPDILDIGCGPGQQTVTLAKHTNGMITAVDNHQRFLDVLDHRIRNAGFGDRVRVMNMDMNELDFPGESFDLIWSEGAIFIMGFEKGLRSWKRLVKPGGYLAVTDAAWLLPDPPEAARRLWEEYPTMTDVQTCLDMIERSGFENVGHFTLPATAWLDEYFAPLEQRLVRFRDQYTGVEQALGLADALQNEIDIYRSNGNSYGYVFFVMRNL